MSAYGEYGNRQEEFGYLSTESQTEVVEYCHAIANTMNEARNAGRGEVTPVEPVWTPVFVWYYLPNTNTRVTGLMLGFAPGRPDTARVRRDDDGRVYRVPASVLRR